MKEETGYDIEINRLLGVYDNIVRVGPSKNLIALIVNVICITRIVSGTLNFHENKEIIRAKWFPFARAKKLRMPPNAKRILQDTFPTLVDKDREEGDVKVLQREAKGIRRSMRQCLLYQTEMSLSIGIWAYNKEANLGSLLRNILYEQILTFTFKVIAVCSG